MKKIKLTGKLSLNKETVAKLNDDQMNNINGGGTIVTIGGKTCNAVDTCINLYTNMACMDTLVASNCVTAEC